MTKRDFFTAIVNADINDEMTAFAEHELANLDKTNDARRKKALEKSAAKELEDAPIREAIVACMTNEPKTATMLIAEAGVEIKPQRMPTLLKAMVESGALVKDSIKVTGKGRQVGYRLA